MKCPDFLKLIIVMVFISATFAAEAQKPERPNILIILADDLGHGDFLEYAQFAGMALLLSLMIYANANDWLGWGK